MPKSPDDKKFNETLQNLLKTPPEPHKLKGKEKPRKGSVKKNTAKKSERAAR